MGNMMPVAFLFGKICDDRSEPVMRNNMETLTKLLESEQRFRAQSPWNAEGTHYTVILDNDVIQCKAMCLKDYRQAIHTVRIVGSKSCDDVIFGLQMAEATMMRKLKRYDEGATL